MVSSPGSSQASVTESTVDVAVRFVGAAGGALSKIITVTVSASERVPSETFRVMV